MEESFTFSLHDCLVENRMILVETDWVKTIYKENVSKKCIINCPKLELGIWYFEESWSKITTSKHKRSIRRTNKVGPIYHTIVIQVVFTNEFENDRVSSIALESYSCLEVRIERSQNSQCEVCFLIYKVRFNIWQVWFSSEEYCENHNNSSSTKWLKARVTGR